MKRAKSQFVIWHYAQFDGACVLSDLEGVEDSYELPEGMSRANNFPDKAQFRMDPDFPDDTLLIDNLLNEDFLIVASPRLTQLVQRTVSSHVEYLPVSIINHKGKVASRDYRIINPIDPVACLDFEKSGAEWDDIDDESVESVKRLVLKEAEIPENRLLFRPRSFYQVILVRRALAETISAEGITGVDWLDIDDYPED